MGLFNLLFGSRDTPDPDDQPPSYRDWYPDGDTIADESVYGVITQEADEPVYVTINGARHESDDWERHLARGCLICVHCLDRRVIDCNGCDGTGEVHGDPCGTCHGVSVIACFFCVR